MEGRGRIAQGYLLPEVSGLEGVSAPTQLGIYPGAGAISGQGRFRSLPLGVRGPASASTPAPSRCASLSKSPSPRSLTRRLLPPSRPSARSSPLGPSFRTPPPEAGKPRPGLEPRQQVQTPPTLAPHLRDPPWPGAPTLFPLPGSVKVRVGACAGGPAGPVDRRTLKGEIQDRLPGPHVPGLASVPCSQPALNEVRALSHSVTVHGETLTRTPSLDLHASLSLPDGPGEASLPAPSPARQAGRVDAQPGTGRGSWCLGRKAAAPLVPACPLLASSSSPQDPRPGLAARWNSPSGGPPKTWRGRGEGSRPRQAWGEIPRPLPLGPTPPSPLISQQRPPAAPRAWGEASAGAWESAAVGGGGSKGEGRGRRWGRPEPQSLRCLAPQCASPPLTRPPPRCPAWKDLSPLCQYPHSPCLSWKIGVSREDSR